MNPIEAGARAIAQYIYGDEYSQQSLSWDDWWKAQPASSHRVAKEAADAAAIAMVGALSDDALTAVLTVTQDPSKPLRLADAVRAELTKQLTED